MTAFDLGSNTFRAVEIECTSQRFIASYEKIVRTADALVQTGRISEAAVERICDAIDASKKEVSFDCVRAVTTEALRRAENSAEVLETIHKRSGICFEVITPEQEAMLTLKAVKHRLLQLGLPSKDFVLLDIGGGSTELTFVGKESVSQSFKAGIVTLTQESTPKTFEQILQRTLEPIKAFIQTCENDVVPLQFVATAGTPTTIAAFSMGMDYESYDPAKINGFRLNKAVCEEALEKLLALDMHERARYVGIGKEDLIITGVKLFMAFYSLLGSSECTIIDDGLREGLALSMCEEENDE